MPENERSETNGISEASRKKFWLIVYLLLLVHLLIALALALFFQPSGNSIILRYNVYFGVDILAAWWQVYLLPLLSLAFTLGNLFLAFRFLKKGEWLLSILLLLGSAVISFGLAIAIAALVLINY